jgi:type VI secretion system protein ImpG
MKGSFDDDIVRYYNAELTYLRRMGVEFAARYPKIAARLELGPDESPDPHVERLLEAFAFLSARIQYKMDSDFPEIPGALLDVLYPSLVQPIPPATIVQFRVAPESPPPPEGSLVPSGSTLNVAAETGPSCRFRTSYAVRLLPVEIAEVSLLPTTAYDFLNTTDVAGVLAIRLVALGGASFDAMPGLDRLRFHITGDPLTTRTLYEMVNANAGSVMLSAGRRKTPVALPPSAIRPVGLADDEALLLDAPNGHPGYRLLQEYFAFPEKFLFFDITGLDRRPPGNELEILICLHTRPTDMPKLAPDNLRLNCTPALNLFPKSAEPIRLDHRSAEYAINPDVRREAYTEIHSITEVSLSARDDRPSEILTPYFSFDHFREDFQSIFWVAQRRPTGRANLPGTEMIMRFVDLDFTMKRPPAETVYIKTLATNRNLAEQVPAGALMMPDVPVPAREIICLRRPTPTVYPELDGATYWKLVSQLSLNHLSLGRGPESLEALQEILFLYCPSNIPSARHQIAGLTRLEANPVVRRVGRDAWRGFCQGTSVQIEVDQRAFVGSSALMLGTVLSRFFALYAALNSFVEVSLVAKQREGVWKQWPPTIGDLALI